jgi:hypothetical protein
MKIFVSTSVATLASYIFVVLIIDTTSPDEQSCFAGLPFFGLETAINLNMSSSSVSGKIDAQHTQMNRGLMMIQRRS